MEPEKKDEIESIVHLVSVGYVYIRGFHSESTWPSPFLEASNITSVLELDGITYNTTTEPLSIDDESSLLALKVLNSSFNGLPADTYNVTPPPGYYSVLILNGVKDDELNVSADILKIVDSSNVTLSLMSNASKVVVQGTQNVSIVSSSMNSIGRLIAESTRSLTINDLNVSYLSTRHVEDLIIENSTIQTVYVRNSTGVEITPGTSHSLDFLRFKTYYSSNILLANISISTPFDSFYFFNTSSITLENIELLNPEIYFWFTGNITLRNITIDENIDYPSSVLSFVGGSESIPWIENVTINGKPLVVYNNSILGRNAVDLLNSVGGLVLVNSTLLLEDLEGDMDKPIIAWNSSVIVNGSDIVFHSSLSLTNGSQIFINKSSVKVNRGFMLYKSSLQLEDASFYIDDGDYDLTALPYVYIMESSINASGSLIEDYQNHYNIPYMTVYGASSIYLYNSSLSYVETRWRNPWGSTDPGSITLKDSNVVVTGSYYYWSYCWIRAFSQVKITAENSNITGDITTFSDTDISFGSTYMNDVKISLYKGRHDIQFNNVTGGFSIDADNENTHANVTIQDSNLYRLSIKLRSSSRLEINNTNATDATITTLDDWGLGSSHNITVLNSYFNGGTLDFELSYPGSLEMNGNLFNNTGVDISYRLHGFYRDPSNAPVNLSSPKIVIGNNTFTSLRSGYALRLNEHGTFALNAGCYLSMLQDNTFHDARYSLYIYGGYALVSHNTFYNLSNGPVLMGGRGYSIEYNNFTNILNYYIIALEYFGVSPLVNSKGNVFDGVEALVINKSHGISVSDKMVPYVVVRDSSDVALEGIVTSGKVLPEVIVYNSSNISMRRIKANANEPIPGSCGVCYYSLNLVQLMLSSNVSIADSVINATKATSGSSVEGEKILFSYGTLGLHLHNTSIINDKLEDLYRPGVSAELDYSTGDMSSLSRVSGKVDLYGSEFNITDSNISLETGNSNIRIIGSNLMSLEDLHSSVPYYLWLKNANVTLEKSIVIQDSNITHVHIDPITPLRTVRIINSTVTGQVSISQAREVYVVGAEVQAGGTVSIDYVDILNIEGGTLSGVAIDHAGIVVLRKLHLAGALDRASLMLRGAASTTLEDVDADPGVLPIDFAYTNVFEYGRISLSNVSSGGLPIEVYTDTIGADLDGIYSELVVYNASNLSLSGGIESKAWIVLSANVEINAWSTDYAVIGSQAYFHDTSFTRLSVENGLGITLDNVTAGPLVEDGVSIRMFRMYPLVISNSIFNVTPGEVEAVKIWSYNTSITNSIFYSTSLASPASRSGVLYVDETYLEGGELPIEGSMLLISGSRFENTSTGIRTHVDKVVVENTTLSTYTSSLYVSSGSLVLNSSTITVADLSYEGVSIHNGHATILYTNITGSGDGTLLDTYRPSRMEIRNSRISLVNASEDSSALYIYGVDELELMDSYIATDSGYALSLYSSNVTIVNNTFISMDGSTVRLGDSTGVLAYNNLTAGNYAFYVKYPSYEGNMLVYMNYIDSNKTIYSRYSGASISFNMSNVPYFYNGTCHVSGIGNYWTSYNGSDSDGDGVGDDPYYLGSSYYGGEEYYDYYPLITPPGNYKVAEPPLIEPAESNATVFVNDTVAYVFNITNTGMRPHVFQINASSGELNTSILRLEPGETAFFKLSYTPPSEGIHVINITVTEDSVDCFNWTVKAVTNAVPKISSFYIADVEPDYTTNITVGETAVFNVTVTYNGTVNDTIKASVDRGTVTPSQAQVSPDSNTSFTVEYTPKTPGEYNISLLLISSFDSNVNATVVLKVRAIAPPVNFTVLPETSNITVITGETAIHIFNITNTGDVEDTYNITSDSGVLNTTSITLEPGQTGWFQLSYTSNKPGVYTSNITVVSTLYPLLNKTVQAVTTVRPPVRNVTIVDVSPGYNESIEWNETAVFNITIANYGEIDENLTASSNLGSVNPSSLVLSVGSNAVLMLSFDPPGPGNYTITLYIQSVDNVINLTTKLHVNVTGPERGVSILGVYPSDNQTVVTGDTAEFRVTIENVGEVAENLSLSVDLGNVVPKNIILDPGEQANVTVGYTPSEPGNYTIILTITSNDSYINITRQLYVTARQPIRNITITKVYPSTNQSIFTDEQAIFNITIANQGEVTENITINASLGSVNPSNITLEPGNESNATLTFNPPGPGNYTITVTASTIDGAVSDSIVLHVEAKPVRAELNITPPYQEAVILDNETAEYEFNITNLGDRTDNITITVDYGNVTPSNMVLEPNETGTITLYVSGPPGVITSTITVSSSINPGYNVTATANTTILARYNWTAEIIDYNDTGQVGGNITVTIMIHNTGALSDTYEINSPHSITPLNITIPGGAVKTANLTLRFSEPGLYHENITATSLATGDTITLHANITIYISIHESITRNPANLTLYIPETNTSITLSLTGAGGIKVLVYPDNIPPTPPGPHLYYVQDIILTAPGNTSEPIIIVIGYNESYINTLHISEEALKPYLYNESTGQWQEFKNYTIDTVHNKVTIYASLEELRGTPIILASPPIQVGGELVGTNNYKPDIVPVTIGLATLILLISYMIVRRKQV